MIGDVTVGMTANRMALHINMAYQKAGLTKSIFIKAKQMLICAQSGVNMFNIVLDPKC